MYFNTITVVAMRPNEIRAEIIRLDLTVKGISRDLNKHRAAVSAVIAGDRPNPVIRAGIAKAIGRPVEEVFDSINYPPSAGPGRPRKTTNQEVTP